MIAEVKAAAEAKGGLDMRVVTAMEGDQGWPGQGQMSKGVDPVKVESCFRL